MKTLVVIPTYNERSNLVTLVARILVLDVPDLAVLVVDDSSPDGTGVAADTLAAAHRGKVFSLHRPGKLGLGTAYLDGFRWGVAHGFDALCEMDADGSHDPDALPALVGAVERGVADVAIGSRRVRGGTTIGWGPHRHLMSHGAMSFSRLALGLRTRDVTSGYRCYSSATVRELLGRKILSNGYAFQEETLYYCEKLGFRVREIPIVFRDRTIGRSKLSWREVPEFFATIRRLRGMPAPRRAA
jgi:dolichol-phosphate mannosyltransferase